MRRSARTYIAARQPKRPASVGRAAKKATGSLIKIVAATPVVSPAPAPKNNLRPPWQKGQSGNPTGYPKKYAQIVKLARAHSPRAIKRLGELLESGDERVAAVAAQALLERAWGKPREFADESEPAHMELPSSLNFGKKVCPLTPPFARRPGEPTGHFYNGETLEAAIAN